MRFRFVTNWGEQSCFFFFQKGNERRRRRNEGGGTRGAVLLVINLIFSKGFPMEISDGKLSSVIWSNDNRIIWLNQTTIEIDTWNWLNKKKYYVRLHIVKILSKK